MFKALLLLQVFLFQSKIFIDASIRNDKVRNSRLGNDVIKEQSSDQLSVREQEKENPENDQLYYLPTQTMFGETNIQTSTRVLSTFPPHISIDPAPIQTSYVETTNALHKDHSAEDFHYKEPYLSQCVSETPAIQLESHLLLRSSDLGKESVIMSGHLEIASKTSTVEDITEVHPIVSVPSIAVQGTVLNSHPIRDL